MGGVPGGTGCAALGACTLGEGRPFTSLRAFRGFLSRLQYTVYRAKTLLLLRVPLSHPAFSMSDGGECLATSRRRIATPIGGGLRRFLHPQLASRGAKALPLTQGPLPCQHCAVHGLQHERGAGVPRAADRA